MKFKIKVSELKKWLSIVNHAISSITTTPILENILIKVNYNNIVLTSNNLEMAIEYVIDENIKIEKEWTICIPSKLFSSYIWLIQDEELNISSDDKLNLSIENEYSKIKIKWLSAEDFPLIPNIKEDKKVLIKWSILKKSIEKTLFSTAEWNIRPNLAGIYTSIEWEKISFASTDSYRMSEYINYLEQNLNWENISCIIPNKTTYELKSTIEDNDQVKIVLSDNQIAFLFWKTKIYSRLLNWKFPDYKVFFPNSYSTKVELNRIDLINALRKINLISKENNYSIKISFSSENWILIESNETQIWEWSIKINWNIEWEDNIIWINSTYFLEVLWVIEDSHIEISFESALSQISIKPITDEKKKEDKSEFRHIIMPLKI